MKRLKSTFALSLMLLGGGVFLSQTADAQEQGGDVIVSINSDAVSMDPHGSNDVPSNQMSTTLYEGLVKLDENMEIQPLLATEWEAVDDTTWVLNYLYKNTTSCVKQVVAITHSFRYSTRIV